MTPATETPEEVVEGQAREIEPVGNGAMERVPPAPPVSLEVTPAASAGELVARMDVIKQAMEQAMRADVDYGVIPGTGSKPTLLKPGAEKLGVLFQLDLQPENEKIWHDDGHLTVISRVTAFYAPSGARLGGGEGICTTREKKYAKRRADRLCPQCGQATVLESRDRNTKQPDGSLFCWKKKGGCGANFAAGSDQAKALLAVKPGDVDNPDIADTYNTVLKMAEKRGRVDAVLAVTGASALFTQDVEDQASAAPAEDPGPVEGASQQTQSTAELTIDDAGVDRLKQGIKNSGIGFSRLCALMGSIGAERPKIKREDSITVALRALTIRRAEQLEQLLLAESERGDR